MTRSLQDTVRELCLGWPEAQERVSHGMPTYKVRGKSFASYVVNHHGDGRVALWLNAPPGAQDWYVGAADGPYFVPPYLGTRGWLGVELNKGLPWKRIAGLVREAYEKTAPPALAAVLGRTPAIAPPSRRPTAAEIDPLRSPRGRLLLKTLRKVCLGLPETREALQFGYPVWQAGKKTFAWASCADARMSALFWVGVDRQGMLVEDSRFRIPAYLGHNGWIALDVSEHFHAGELTQFAEQSYRHFAAKRMMLKLGLIGVQ